MKSAVWDAKDNDLRYPYIQYQYEYQYEFQKVMKVKRLLVKKVSVSTKVQTVVPIIIQNDCFNGVTSKPPPRSMLRCSSLDH